MRYIVETDAPLALRGMINMPALKISAIGEDTNAGLEGEWLITKKDGFFVTAPRTCSRCGAEEGENVPFCKWCGSHNTKVRVVKDAVQSSKART